ncbi:COX15/CtaA family protein [Arthrobacter sp. MYb213]|uniref:COX15/CtaA family protein n=1 Tax=Arthrobacter sp. MYb213 TaxID=1848595 RepID=UPI000CFCB1D8|nr:COX15/CtaA family protein [Arthrobacter sp. MYb213]PRB72519.1 cytochrome oxidase assembly protein [Arthrobacter sp. MYb213]
MRTPFAWLEHRFPLERRPLRSASLAALIAAILIILGGGVVRVTGSGLGCPDWPTCVGGSIAPTAEMGLHSVIEFVNRLLTVGLCIVVGWVIIAARLQRKQAPEVTRWAWMQFWFVVLNAVIGGITVWVDLNPYVVAGHFLAATLLLTAATITWQKTQNLDKPELPASSLKSRTLARWLLALTAVLLILGTTVAGTGPHAGDSAQVPRMPFSWIWVTIIHGAAALASLTFAGLLWRSAKLAGEQMLAQKALLFIFVFLGQGALGIIQSLTHLPELMVVLHLVGSALVWIGAVRVLLAAEGNHRAPTRSPSLALKK